MSAIQPPPRTVEKFNYVWKDWLYFLYDTIKDYVVDVAALAADIATNAANIATNTTNISTNTTNISTNATNIATNTGDIATNAADIATNAGDIATNAADIATLQTLTGTGIVGPFGWSYVLKSTSVDTSYNVAAADIMILADPDTGNFTITLPAIAGIADGRLLIVKNIDVAATGYTVDLARSSTDVIDDGAGSTTTSLSISAAASVTLVADQTNSTWWII